MWGFEKHLRFLKRAWFLKGTPLAFVCVCTFQLNDIRSVWESTQSCQDIFFFPLNDKSCAIDYQE